MSFPLLGDSTAFGLMCVKIQHFLCSLMAYHKEPFQPMGWELVLGFLSLLSDSCLLTRGNLTDPVLLHFHSHLQQQEGEVLVTSRSSQLIMWHLLNNSVYSFTLYMNDDKSPSLSKIITYCSYFKKKIFNAHSILSREKSISARNGKSNPEVNPPLVKQTNLCHWRCCLIMSCSSQKPDCDSYQILTCCRVRGKAKQNRSAQLLDMNFSLMKNTRR